MDVKTLCLGVLTFEEASGYDIKKYFEHSFSHFFVAGFGSIYPALSELTKDGLATYHEVFQDGKPDRKVYRITERGRALFAKALEETPPRHKIRSEFLVLMYFAHLLPPERLNEVLSQRRSEVIESLKMIEDCIAIEPDLPAGIRFGAGLGKAMLTTMRNYIDRNRHMLFEDGADQTTAGAA